MNRSAWEGGQEFPGVTGPLMAWQTDQVRQKDQRVVCLLWAGFWTLFVMMHVFTDGISSLYYGSIIVVPMLAAIVTAWVWPRVGGAVLIIFGVAPMFYFDYKGFWSIIHPMSMPPIVCGLLLVMFVPKSP